MIYMERNRNRGLDFIENNQRSSLLFVERELMSKLVDFVISCRPSLMFEFQEFKMLRGNYGRDDGARE